MKDGFTIKKDTFTPFTKEIEQEGFNKIHGDLKKIENDMLNTIKKRTPVDTGTLKKAWDSKLDVKDDVEITFMNNKEYAYPVENGHFTKSGSFVEGEFMLRDTINEYEKEIERTIKKMFR